MSTGVQERDYLAIMKGHKTSVERRLAVLREFTEPKFVYEPIRYVLGSGGKRVRSVLVLLACEAVGGDARAALDAAVAVELLHNFTLIHDDVMDNADMRRCQPTVHKKWNRDVAILSGDELTAHAYRFLLRTESSRVNEIFAVFTDAFIQVCEGQGFDKEFERRQDITVEDYFMMINKKTARMISAATEIGALTGNGTPREVKALRRFGEHLGMAFQIKDDLLDIVGDEEKVGKTIGGDIKEGKKTFLLVKALERAKGSDRKFLRKVVPNNGMNKHALRTILDIYRRECVLDDARNEIAHRTRLAEKELAILEPGKAKSTLLWLSSRLLERNS